MLQAFLIAVSVSLIAAAVIASVRLVKGPTAPDRVIAGDLMVNMFLALMVLLGIYFDQPVMLDTALLLAFLTFIGTLAVAKYLEGRGLGD